MINDDVDMVRCQLKYLIINTALILYNFQSVYLYDVTKTRIVDLE